MAQILNWVSAVTATAASAQFHELKAVGVGEKKDKGYQLFYLLFL